MSCLRNFLYSLVLGYISRKYAAMINVTDSPAYLSTAQVKMLGDYAYTVVLL